MVTPVISRPFPYTLHPLTNITPFTYRDGETYLSILEKIRAYMRDTLVPDINSHFEELLSDFQAGIKNIEMRVADSEASYTKQLKDFIDSINAYLKEHAEPIIFEEVTKVIRKLLSTSTHVILNPDFYDIYPNDLSRDSTKGVQDAVDFAQENGIGLIEWPSFTLKINGTVRIKHPLHIKGQYGAHPTDSTNNPYKRVGGSAFVTDGGTPGTFVFDIAPDGLGVGEGGKVISPEEGGNRILGFKIENLYGYSGPLDNGVERGGIHMASVHTEVHLSDIKLLNFRRQALSFEGVYDGTMSGVTLITCGTETYPAFELLKNTNALHIFGIHIESCEYPLYLGPAARHNQFVGGKIEMYTYGPKLSPIRVTRAYENYFTGMQFVDHNADDPLYYGSHAQPHMISCEGVITKTIFDSCIFTTSGYRSVELGGDKGTRWIKSSDGAVTTIDGGMFETCWGGSGAAAIDLGDNGTLVNAHIVSRMFQNQRNLFAVGKDCIIDGVRITGTDALTECLGGVLIRASGDGNTWGPSNKIRVTCFDFFQGSTSQQLHETDRVNFALPDAGKPTPNLGWQTRGNTRLFNAFTALPVTWTGFTGYRAVNDEITIQFVDPTITIANGAKFGLKGGVDASPPAGAYMHFRFTGTKYVELWRSY